jgi:large subunit ribosomal protein L15|tara:strand:+ start:78 stop:524 length:447 start_codon:yes stop_codon:yes gene_type:complete
MNLHTLSPAPGSRKTRKRIARGNSAGGGTTAGRGTKGQHSRRGSGRRFGFEGGQTPLLRRQPKFGGFTNPNRKEYEVVNLSVLEEKLTAGSYDQAALRAARVVRTKKPIKLLARGEVQKKFTLTVDAASTKACEAVSKAGGKVTTSSN